MKKGLFAFLLTFMLGIFTVSAQVENPAQWSYSQKSLGNNEYELVFKAALEPGWHIYSMYTPEGGPMATTVTFEEAGKGIELVGKATENEPKKEHDDVFEGMDFEWQKVYYKDKLQAVYTLPGYSTKVIWTSHPRRYSYLGTNIEEMAGSLADTFAAIR